MSSNLNQDLQALAAITAEGMVAKAKLEAGKYEDPSQRDAFVEGYLHGLKNFNDVIQMAVAVQNMHTPRQAPRRAYVPKESEPYTLLEHLIGVSLIDKLTGHKK